MNRELNLIFSFCTARMCWRGLLKDVPSLSRRQAKWPLTLGVLLVFFVPFMLLKLLVPVTFDSVQALSSSSSWKVSASATRVCFCVVFFHSQVCPWCSAAAGSLWKRCLCGRLQQSGPPHPWPRGLQDRWSQAALAAVRPRSRAALCIPSCASYIQTPVSALMCSLSSSLFSPISSNNTLHGKGYFL